MNNPKLRLIMRIIISAVAVSVVYGVGIWLNSL
jgi:hypothetical protein